MSMKQYATLLNGRRNLDETEYCKTRSLQMQVFNLI